MIGWDNERAVNIVDIWKIYWMYYTNIFIMDYIESVATAFNTSVILYTAAGINTALPSVAKAVWTSWSRVGRIILKVFQFSINYYNPYTGKSTVKMPL